MSLDDAAQPSVKYCTDTVNARHIHGRPRSPSSSSVRATR